MFQENIKKHNDLLLTGEEHKRHYILIIYFNKFIYVIYVLIIYNKCISYITLWNIYRLSVQKKLLKLHIKDWNIRLRYLNKMNSLNSKILKGKQNHYL